MAFYRTNLSFLCCCCFYIFCPPLYFPCKKHWHKSFKNYTDSSISSLFILNSFLSLWMCLCAYKNLWITITLSDRFLFWLSSIFASIHYQIFIQQMLLYNSENWHLYCVTCAPKIKMYRIKMNQRKKYSASNQNSIDKQENRNVCISMLYLHCAAFPDVTCWSLFPWKIAKLYSFREGIQKKTSINLHILPSVEITL